MKRYIYGMAVTRSYLIGKLEGYSAVIYEHLMKIVTSEYTPNAKYTDKWINDISRALYNVSKMSLTNKCKRLDASTYDKYLFSSHFGNAEYDMQHHLEDFQEEYPEYSNYEVTAHMVGNLFNIVKEIRSTIPTMIAEHKGTEGLPIPRFCSVLRSIISKYIEFKVGEDNWK